MIKGFNFSRDFVSRKTVSDFVARQFYFALQNKTVWQLCCLKNLIIIHIPQMNNTSTYGIEQPNGSVLYNIFHESVFHTDILYQFRIGHTVQIYDSEHIKAAQSIDDYFNESRFLNESSNVRGVLKLDGTIEYRYFDDKGIYVFKNIGHP